MVQQTRQTRRRPGPKPRGPYADQRRTITTRITEKRRHELEKSAERRDRSLSQEIEFRIEQSFEADRRREDVMEAVYTTMGGIDNYGVLSLMGSNFKYFENKFGKRWTDDPEVFAIAIGSMSEVMGGFGPSARLPKEEHNKAFGRGVSFAQGVLLAAGRLSKAKAKKLKKGGKK